MSDLRKGRLDDCLKLTDVLIRPVASVLFDDYETAPVRSRLSD